MNLNLQRVDDGPGIAQTMLSNKAIYHHSCRTKFRDRYLQRALDKRKEQEEDEVEHTNPKKTRSSFNASIDRDMDQCVMCLKYQKDEPNNKVHHSTMH